MRVKIINVLTKIFSYVMVLCLIAALVGGIMIFVAFFIGADRAEPFMIWINEYLKIVYVVGGTLAILGVVKMYFAGEKNFFIEVFGKTKDAGKNN